MAYQSKESKKPQGSYKKLKPPKDLIAAKTPRESDRSGSRFYGAKPGTAYTPQPLEIPRIFDDKPASDVMTRQTLNPDGTFTTKQGIPATPPPPGTVGATGDSMGGYAPAAVLSGFLNQNPDVLAADVLGGMGINNMDVTKMLADLVGAGPALYLLTQGANADFQTTPGQEVGYANALAESLMTPGAGGFSLDGLMQTILNADPNSPLGAFLATGGPDAVNDLIRTAAMMGTSNPYFQQGIDKQLDEMDLGYRQDFAHGAVQTPDAYYQAVRNGNLGKYF